MLRLRLFRHEFTLSFSIEHVRNNNLIDGITTTATCLNVDIPECRPKTDNTKDKQKQKKKLRN